MSRKAISADVAIVGGGPVGLTCSLLLGRLGFRVALVAPQGALMQPDRRTAALFAGSITLLRNLGIWHDVSASAEPIQAIRIIDDRGQLLRAPEAMFHARELGLSELGFNVPNAVLTAALLRAVQGEPSLQVIDATASAVLIEASGASVTLDTGAQVSADVVVGADGRKSLVRQAAAIATREWAYPQSALVTTFRHARAHRGVSTEFHRRHGPLTTVPMPGSSSSLVWVEGPQEAERLVGLADDAFRAELEHRLSGLLGSIESVAPRATFPLSGMAASTLGRDRAALIGEAGHVMPPIGAQGLNLGLRDAAVLAECLHESEKDWTAAVAGYAAARAPDVMSRMTAIDVLNRSLLTDFLPAHLARGLGLFALTTLSPLRRAVVREGLQPSHGVPLLMKAQGAELLSGTLGISSTS